MRIGRLPQHEAPGPVPPIDRRHGAGGPHGQDQPVVVQDLAGAEPHGARAHVDPGDEGVQPCRDVVVLVPALGEQAQPLHRGAAVDQSGDAHAVVQAVRLAADEVDLAIGMAAADEVGRGDPGDAVADDDDADDAPVEVAGATSVAAGAWLRRERHRDGAAVEPGHTRHAGGVGEAEAAQRVALVLIRG